MPWLHNHTLTVKPRATVLHPTGGLFSQDTFGVNCPDDHILLRRKREKWISWHELFLHLSPTSNFLYIYLQAWVCKPVFWKSCQLQSRMLVERIVRHMPPLDYTKRIFTFLSHSRHQTRGSARIYWTSIMNAIESEHDQSLMYSKA